VINSDEQEHEPFEKRKPSPGTNRHDRERILSQLILLPSVATEYRLNPRPCRQAVLRIPRLTPSSPLVANDYL